jgi:uncharacterized protein
MSQNQDRFWERLFQVNAEVSIFYQWEQLEATGCIQNFRIAAGLAEGFREGYFFADSDAYKWLEAASLLLARQKDSRLRELVEGLIDILEKAQEADGYLFTYNQIHFSGVRWKNLQAEHEFYCLGHLIEAGIAHHRATGDPRMLAVARRAADLLVRVFLHAAPIYTDGHAEIEIGLIRLSRVTGESSYRELARNILHARGRIKGYGFVVMREILSMFRRMKIVQKQRNNFYQSQPDHVLVTLPAHNQHITPKRTWFRLIHSILTGKFTQQHAPLVNQTIPIGHGVRFLYLQLAATMLQVDEREEGEVARLTGLWDHMTARRMYVTGGVGSLPLIEGFGRDYELDPQVAYAETCAALGTILWNRELNALTGKASYSDLLEWQLYNAALVGVSLEGTKYFYNNPLVCNNGHRRAKWYAFACCPSNLSRVLASLPEKAAREEGSRLIIDQYVPAVLSLGHNCSLTLTTSLPWEGEVDITFALPYPSKYEINLRIPAWADHFTVLLNDVEIGSGQVTPCDPAQESAVGLHFEDAFYWRQEMAVGDGDRLSLRLNLPIRFRRQDVRLPGCGGKAALTRGPLVYCLESIDNQVDLFDLRIDVDSLATRFDPDLLEGCQVITGKTKNGDLLTWVPYMLWGNRGESRMTMFFEY